MTLRSLMVLIILAALNPCVVGQDARPTSPDSLPTLPTAEPLESAGSSALHSTEASTEPGEPVGPNSEITPVEPEVAPVEMDSTIDETILEGSIEHQLMDGGETDEGWPSCVVGDFTLDFPKWYVRAEMLWLDRTTEGDLATASTRDANGNLGNYRIESNAFKTNPGIRVFAGRNFSDGMTYLELGYTGLYDWSSDRLLGTGTDLQIIESNLDLGLIEMGFSTNQNAQRQSVEYTSILNDGQLNVRSFMSPNFAVIFGTRYLAMNEELVITESGVTATATAPNSQFPYLAKRDINVENGMLTTQMGGDVYWDLTDDIRVNALGKIGLSANFTKSTIRQTAEVDLVAGVPLSRESRVQIDDEVVIAGILDTGMGMDIRLTRNVVLRGGYTFMWLYNVATAPIQNPNVITQQNGLQTQIENSASVFLFGPYVGLQITWGGLD